jgi:transcriptional regulator with XRE-family HTH domain
MPGATDEIDGFYANLGKRVRKARNNKGMSQQTLASHIGLTRSSVANLEAGRQRVPVHLLVQIAATLGRDPAELLPRIDPDQHDEWSEAIEELAGTPDSTRVFVLGALARARPSER